MNYASVIPASLNLPPIPAPSAPLCALGIGIGICVDMSAHALPTPATSHSHTPTHYPQRCLLPPVAAGSSKRGRASPADDADDDSDDDDLSYDSPAYHDIGRGFERLLSQQQQQQHRELFLSAAGASDANKGGGSELGIFANVEDDEEEGQEEEEEEEDDSDSDYSEHDYDSDDFDKDDDEDDGIGEEEIYHLEHDNDGDRGESCHLVQHHDHPVLKRSKPIDIPHGNNATTSINSTATANFPYHHYHHHNLYRNRNLNTLNEGLVPRLLRSTRSLDMPPHAGRASASRLPPSLRAVVVSSSGIVPGRPHEDRPRAADFDDRYFY